MKNKKEVVLFLVSMGLLFLLIYISNISKVIDVLYNTNMYIIAVGCVVWVFESILRTSRWKLLIKEVDNNVTFFQSWKILVKSMFISNITPINIGDLSRPFLLKEVTQTKVSDTLPSLFIERVVDIIILLVMGGIGMFFLVSNISEISDMFYFALFFYVVFILGLIVILLNRKLANLIVKKMFFFSFTKKYEERILSFMNKVYDSLRFYKNIKTLILFIIISSVLWLTESFILMLCFYSVGISTSFLVYITSTGLATTIGAITFLPGSLGSFEIVVVMIFTMLFAFSLSKITTGLILNRLISALPYTFIGAFIFFWESKFLQRIIKRFNKSTGLVA